MKSVGVFATFLLILCGVGHAQLPEPGDAASLAGELRASDVIGARVHNADGEDIGEIEDLVLSRERLAATAIVSVGGFLDIGDRLIAVPFDDLGVAADGETFLLAMSDAELALAPEYSGAAARRTVSRRTVSESFPTPPPAHEPDAAAQSEAREEAAEIFAADDPRVARGIAASKEAYEDAPAEPGGAPEPDPAQEPDAARKPNLPRAPW